MRLLGLIEIIEQEWPGLRIARVRIGPSPRWRRHRRLATWECHAPGATSFLILKDVRVARNLITPPRHAERDGQPRDSRVVMNAFGSAY
jgi:hypothetical protein